MIVIKKSTAPDKLVELQLQAVERGLTANDAYVELQNPLKGNVIEQLKRDQGGLCAYCMRRIPDDRDETRGAKSIVRNKIEHWNARNGENGETCGAAGALDYGNMLLVCSGNQNGISGGKKHRSDNKLTCDAKRGNQKLTVNPLDSGTLATIYYHSDGKIDAEDEIIAHDLDIILNLNCNEDAVQLPAERKKVLEEIEHEIESFLILEQEEGVDFIESCRNLYQELQAIEEEKPPYIGIALWRLQGFI